MDFENYRKNVIEKGEAAFKFILSSPQKPCEIQKKESLMIEYARHGENYLNLKDNEIKFMVVGRAPGKFDAKKSCSVINYDNMTTNVNAIEHCFAVHFYEKEQCNIKENLSWIHSEDAKRNKKYIDSFPFFSFSKKVYLKLTDQRQDFDWYKNICYSNIFKIVSLTGGNPSSHSILMQEKFMLEIFKAEIAYYKPTHILVLDSETDSHCWCSVDFKNAIKDYAKNHKTKVCFSNRPEFRKTTDLMTTVERDFDIK